ncbi:hypothetical protein WJX73_000680 [Symbiochloris irregularis]|uniref:Uncharacterized protein n=1 Tax=Symbiochloris irregularis TaxID=706552 RepID=A0AAW1P5L8_9CHLO
MSSDQCRPEPFRRAASARARYHVTLLQSGRAPPGRAYEVAGPASDSLLDPLKGTGCTITLTDVTCGCA